MTKASRSHYLLSLWIDVPGGSPNRWATFPVGRTPPTLDSVGAREVVRKREVEREERKWCLFAFRYAVGFACGEESGPELLILGMVNPCSNVYPESSLQLCQRRVRSIAPYSWA